jgi:large subunit ribosomal protein L25
MVAQPGVVTHYMVPVEGKGSPVGLKNKGMLFYAKTRVRVKAAIENLPNKITVDVSAMDVGDAKMIRDLPVIENVKYTDSDRVSVLSVIKAK